MKTTLDFLFGHLHKERSPATALNGARLLTLNASDRVANTDIPTIVLSYKYRLRPTRQQHEALERICDSQRQLYNAALEERIDCYRKTGKGRSYIDQCKSLTELRGDPEFSAVALNIQRWTLKRIDEAFMGFFSRLGRGEKPGFPRFRSKSRWSSFGFNQFEGITIDGHHLRFKGMLGTLRVNFHRLLPPGKPLSCSFSKDAKGWSASFQMRVPAEARVANESQVGIDVGLSKLAALSTGEKIENQRQTKMAEKEIRRRNRALSRCERGSKRRAKVRARLAKAHAKVANSRLTYLHQVSARLVRENDLIAIEKLNVKGLARSHLAKSVNDAAWGKLIQMLRYKVAKTGGELIEVDPRHTSQTCPSCFTVKKKGLSERVHSCPCGCVLDRDVAAAKVILHRAVLGPGFAKPLVTAA